MAYINGNEVNDAILVRTVNNGALRNYSTNEQVVGTWINGKPLYEKTIIIQNITASDFGENLSRYGINNVDYAFIEQSNIIDSGNICFSQNSTLIMATGASVTARDVTVATAYLSISGSESTVEIQVSQNSATGSDLLLPVTAYVTIRYTKTTDTVTT